MLQVVFYIIDLEVNEENQGGVKSGNKKDVEMCLWVNIVIIKILNSFSEKIMVNVVFLDGLLDDKVDGGDCDIYNEFVFCDFRGDVKQ